MQRYLLLVILLLASLSAADAATYYVSKQGGASNSNDGLTTSTPWLTNTGSGGVNGRTFQPGDQILYRCGDTWLADPLIVRSQGTSGSRILFSSWGTGGNTCTGTNRPIFDNNFSTTVDQNWMGVVQAEGAKWVTIENFEARNTDKEIVSIYRGSASTSTGVTVKNCLVHTQTQGAGQIQGSLLISNGTNGAVFTAQGDVTNVTIDGCEVYGGNWNGIVFLDGVTNSTVKNNIVHDHSLHGGINTKRVFTSFFNLALTIQDNTVFDNGEEISLGDLSNSIIERNRTYETSANAGMGIGIKQQGGADVGLYNNNTIRQNLIYNNPGDCMQLEHTSNSQVYNNTCYNNTGAVLNVFGTNSGQSTANQLGYQNSSGNTAGFDGRFANAAAADFRLCTAVNVPISGCAGASNAIDAGSNVGLPFNGAAPDLGALETGGAPTVPAAPANLRVVSP